MRPWYFALIALGAAALGAAAWWYTSPGPSPAGRQADGLGILVPEEFKGQADAVRMIADELAVATEYSAFFAGLQRAFPADYRQAIDSFAKRATATGRLDASDVYFTEAFRALRQTRGILAAKASAPALGRIFDAQAGVLKAMGVVDPHLCVDAIYGGATDAYFGFAATHRAAVAEQGEANLAAILEGQHPGGEKAPPTDSDFQAVEQSLTGNGLSRTEISVLMDGKGATPPIADARMCTIEQIYLEVLRSLPDDRRQRIYRLTVELMART